MKPITNLWLDDARPCPYVGNWKIAKNYQEAVDIMTQYQVRNASLDHDLSFEHYESDNVSGYTEKTGYDFVKWMEDNDCWPQLPPIVHSYNPIGAYRMAQILARHYDCHSEELLIPYKAPR